MYLVYWTNSNVDVGGGLSPPGVRLEGDVGAEDEDGDNEVEGGTVEQAGQHEGDQKPGGQTRTTSVNILELRDSQ